MRIPQGTQLSRFDDFIIRSIALYKALKGVLALALAFYILTLIRRRVPSILNYLVETLNINFEKGVIHWALTKAAPFIDQHIRSIDFIIVIYAFIYLAEGVGLYFRERWAEYLVVAETCVPLPFELYEIYRGIAYWNVFVLLGNLAVLGYLIRRMQLVHNVEKRATDARLS